MGSLSRLGRGWIVFQVVGLPLCLAHCGGSADTTTEGPARASSDAAAELVECEPKSCTQLGAVCGDAPDTCGGVVSCGQCPPSQRCGGDGANRCGERPCEPKTCSMLGASCGAASDGCSATIDCGNCELPNTCGGAGVPNQCGCTPATCASRGVQCGMVDDGCGRQLNCTEGCCYPFCVAHDACGSDGCNGDCGQCTGDRDCRQGYCVWELGNGTNITCNEVCGWGGAACVGTSVGTCASKTAGIRCYCW